MEIDKSIKKRVNQWLEDDFDIDTKNTIKNLIENNPKELLESFYTNLEFGTGGLRGVMGVGTNRMNIYTVGMATQGLANYLNAQFKGQDIKVAIAYDNRNNNTLFSNTVANVFAANAITAYVFEDLRPTPELSFAIRELGCKSGVMITASHNPKEYSGYKAYWSDGAQVVAPHDTNIIEEVNKITSISQVKWSGNSENIIKIGKEMDEKFIKHVVSIKLSPEAIEKFHDIKIVYTPIHGTGAVIMPKALNAYGFTEVYTVKEQCIADGNFPTVIHPNPEDPKALTMAIDLANKISAELVLASDPDADRIAVAVRDENNNFIALNGNQTCALLTYYMLRRWKELNRLKGNEYVIKTIVTTELIKKIADSFGVECYNVLTGFKFIADVIRQNEGKKVFIGGGEESYGYMIGEFVRDKDSISSGAMFAEIVAWAKTQGKSVMDLLKDIYKEYGFFYEGLVSITKNGMEGLLEIKEMMTKYRETPPKEINGSKVIAIYDYQIGEVMDLITLKKEKINLPQSNVLQFKTQDNSIISVRPSGTEPKIKFYICVCEEMKNQNELESVQQKATKKIEDIKKSMSI